MILNASAAEKIKSLLKKHWFLIGLSLVAGLTLGDQTETLASLGRWLKNNKGPSVSIFLVFLFSGLILDGSQIKEGLTDFKGTFLALLVIFLVAPCVAALFGMFTPNAGIMIGLILVSAMPTTLSSGIVMTGSSGGNMAHALVITIIANFLSILTIPITLTLLLKGMGGVESVAIDKVAITIKLAFLILLPLSLGIFIKQKSGFRLGRVSKWLTISNQILILGLVWMALSQTRKDIIAGHDMILWVVLMVALFHGVLLLALSVIVKIFKIPRGKRESVIFMGGQKTLTLSIILQVSLFPQYGLALAVCVIHHFVHLMMDGYLVGHMKDRE